MPFTGFTAKDLDVFNLPDFESRMPALKANITPKLKELGDDLTPRLSETLGEPLYAHVAQHLRRSVNAPVATWVAFAKEKRAYKPYVHVRAAVTASDFRVVIFVEDYADEKETFAANLVKRASALAAHLKANPEIVAYHVTDSSGAPLSGTRLDSKTLRAFGERMLKVKGQHAAFGIPTPREEVLALGGPNLEQAVVEAAEKLKPLYDLGARRGKS